MVLHAKAAARIGRKLAVLDTGTYGGSKYTKSSGPSASSTDAKSPFRISHPRSAREAARRPSGSKILGFTMRPKGTLNWPLRVHAPEPVEARLVQVEEASAARHIIHFQCIGALRANLVELILVVLEISQRSDEPIYVRFYGLVERNEIRVLIDQNGALEPARRLRCKRKKSAAPPANGSTYV